MSAGILYYTDNRLKEKIAVPVREQILWAAPSLPVVNVSLQPLRFGQNVVLEGAEPGVITMFRQIFIGLGVSTADVIFLCEHDVLYHPSHFDFRPAQDDVYYFNANVWRWDYPKDRLITYNHLTSLSGVCANRELLLRHYKMRLELIEAKGFDNGRDPNWARKMGYEPGKLRRRGGFLDERVEEWRSAYPNIDIRHRKTITPPKVTLDSFRHQPTGWRETTWAEVDGWTVMGSKFEPISGNIKSNETGIAAVA